MNAYDGCIPVAVYMVQKYVGGSIFGKWVNIKGFQDKKKGRGIDVAVETLIQNIKTKETMKTEENKRMLALSCIVADLKAENMELVERVHQLVNDYNDVVRQLNGKETHKDEDPARLFLTDMQKMRDHCDKLEKDIEQLKRQCVQLQIERNDAKTHVKQVDIIQADLCRMLSRFEHSEFLKIGDACTHQGFPPDGDFVKVGSGICNSCRHLVKIDESGKKCVLCAYCHDRTKAKEAQERKTTDD